MYIKIRINKQKLINIIFDSSMQTNRTELMPQRRKGVQLGKKERKRLQLIT